VVTSAPYPEFFAGVVVPMLTPYDADDVAKVDYATLDQFTDYLCSTKVSGLFPVSGMGQWQFLTVAEKKRIMDTVVKASAGRKPVMAGIGSALSYAETYELLEHAHNAGVDAVASVTPPFWDRDPRTGLFVDQKEVYRYYKSVDKRSSLPLSVYDFFAAISHETLRELSLLEHFKGMKYRSDSATDMFRAVQAVEGRVAVTTGIEHNALPSLASGAVGVIGGGPNVIANIVAGIVEAFRAGDLEEARRLQAITCTANDRFVELGRSSYGMRAILKEIIGVPFAYTVRANFVEKLDPGPVPAQQRTEAMDYYRSLELPKYGG